MILHTNDGHRALDAHRLCRLAAYAGRLAGGPGLVDAGDAIQGQAVTSPRGEYIISLINVVATWWCRATTSSTMGWTG